MAALQCHPEVVLCRICIDWLRGNAGTPDSTPILGVRDVAAAAAFYESAGFDVRLYEDDADEPGFAFVEYDDVSVFDLDRAPQITPETNGAGCYLIIANVDGWHDELVAAGLAVTAIEDQPWGMHEFTLTDPDGNHIRIGRAIDSD